MREKEERLMKTAENRHITDITMHTDPKTGYITGDFIFDGRTKKDQVGRFWTTLDMEGNHYIYWEVNVHGWYSRTWRRMKRTSDQYTRISLELKAHVDRQVKMAELVGGDTEYGVDKERELAEELDGEGYSATEAELNELVAASAVGDDKLEIPDFFKRS